jgi:hypothetical protein
MMALKPRRREEDDIQRTVFKHLRMRGVPGIVAWHTPNGGKRNRVEAAIFKGLGVKEGIPDVFVLKDTTLYALELKAQEGRLETTQIDTLSQLSDAGAITGVAYGLDEALIWLQDRGLLRGVMQL